MRTHAILLTLGLLLLAAPTVAADAGADDYGCEVETSVAGFHCFDGLTHQYCVVKWHRAGLQDICPG